jgi:hypothetical protein
MGQHSRHYPLSRLIPKAVTSPAELEQMDDLKSEGCTVLVVACHCFLIRDVRHLSIDFPPAAVPVSPRPNAVITFHIWTVIPSAIECPRMQGFVPEDRPSSRSWVQTSPSYALPPGWHRNEFEWQIPYRHPALANAFTLELHRHVSRVLVRLVEDTPLSEVTEAGTSKLNVQVPLLPLSAPRGQSTRPACCRMLRLVCSLGTPRQQPRRQF